MKNAELEERTNTDVTGDNKPSPYLIWGILLLTVGTTTVIIVCLARRHYLRRSEYLMRASAYGEGRRRRIPRQYHRGMEERVMNERGFTIEDLKEEIVPEHAADDACAICLGNLREWSVSKGKNCKHWFHTHCYRVWVSKDWRCACPLCRQSVF